jgi:hypothetical protein
MLGATILFAIVSPFYRGKTHIQDADEAETR